MIVAFKPREEEKITLFKKQAKKVKGFPEENKRIQRVYRNASIVRSQGKMEVIALARWGIGPDTASQMIEKIMVDKEAFYRDILIAERNYVKTRSFGNEI